MPSTNPHCELADEDQRFLQELALASIRHGLTEHRPVTVDLATVAPALRQPRACFVTLETQGQLRGCIGSLQAVRPLALDVAANAYAAAFRDPRFPELSEDELPQLELHLSLLTVPEPVACASEEELLKLLRPGIDGLILEDGGRRGTFLPSVWEQLPDAAVFLQHLKRKAGFPSDYWSPSLKVYRYRTETIP
ncbi:MAG: AmmeMemoRadiSam system protein A [Methylococcaceae bacterium]|nr:AmmeMemoRadiSam system protein A [Methylococcaceae bacterium]